MSYEKLLNEEKIERVDKEDFDSTLAEKDIEFARNGMGTKNYSRVLAVAYEAVLRAGSRMMNFLGYRAIGREHHKNLFAFLKETGFDVNLVNYFDKIRIKRLSKTQKLKIFVPQKPKVSQVLRSHRRFAPSQQSAGYSQNFSLRDRQSLILHLERSKLLGIIADQQSLSVAFVAPLIVNQPMLNRRIKLVDYKPKWRIKRNAFVYRDVENISREEAEETLEKAEICVQKMRTFVQKIRTGGEKC